MNLSEYAYNEFRLAKGEQPQFEPAQKEAIEALSSFLASDKKCFLLKGYAGTGKTFIISIVCKYLKHSKQIFELMAPTGRASMVLRDKTKLGASTIHRGIYNLDTLIEEELQEKDATKGKDKKKKYKFRYGLRSIEENIRTTYIIDESSMISDGYSEDDFFMFGSGHLLSDLFALVAPANPNRKDKIIFVGDPAQLEPVTDNISGALSKEYLLEKHNLPTQEIEMKDVVRQKTDSGILHNAIYIRELLDTPKHLRNQFKLDLQQADITVLHIEEVVDQYLELNPALDPYRTIIINYTNESCFDYNQALRAKLYDNVNDIYTNDIIMIFQNNMNYDIPLFNGMSGKIVDAALEGKTLSNLFTMNEEGEKMFIDLRFRDVTIEVKDQNSQLQQIDCKILEDFMFDDSPKLDYATNLAIYFDFKERMSKLKIYPGSDEFKQKIKTDPFFNALRLKFGYSVTCHKAQGGEWDNVIVNMDMNQGKYANQFLRWVYTAITRAKEHLYLFNVPSVTQFSKFEYNHKLLEAEIEAAETIHCSLPANYNAILERLDLLNAPLFIQNKFKNIWAISNHFGCIIQARKHDTYYEKYTFQKESETFDVKFNIKGDNTFSSIQLEGRNKPEVASVLKTEFQKTRTILFGKEETEDVQNEKDTTIHFEKDTVDLKALYNTILQPCNEKNISIQGIQHLQDHEVYNFERNAEQASVKFFYRQNHSFTFSEPILKDCNSNQLLEDLHEIFITNLK